MRSVKGRCLVTPSQSRQIIEHFHHPLKFPYFTLLSSSPSPFPGKLSVSHQQRLIYFIQMEYTGYIFWLLQLILSFRDSPMFSKGQYLFFFIAAKDSMIWTHHNLFIHSPFDKHLNYFPFLAISNKTAKTNVYKSVQAYAFSSLGKYLEEELLVSVRITS